mgnify:CR=1 FL=1
MLVVNMLINCFNSIYYGEIHQINLKNSEYGKISYKRNFKKNYIKFAKKFSKFKLLNNVIRVYWITCDTKSNGRIPHDYIIINFQVYKNHLWGYTYTK